jgi:AcrR family transcriptional regulator
MKRTMVRNRFGISAPAGATSPVLPPRRDPAVAYDGDVSDPIELPLTPEPRVERIDAARNRAAILEAAARLLRAGGTESITMDRLACEAGVGKGTVFRRFGDRASLFHALLDDSERRLQEAFIRGPAPLGPGAPPEERLCAFGRALLALTVERGDLLLAAQAPVRGSRFRSPVYGAYLAHIRSLLTELGCEHWEYLADVLLAALDPELVLHQLARGMTLEELERSWEQLVACVAQL